MLKGFLSKRCKELLYVILLISFVLNVLGIWYTVPRCAFPDEESYITKALEVGYVTLSNGPIQGLYAYAFPKSFGPTTIYISIPMSIYIASTIISGEFSEIINAAPAIHHRADFYAQLPDNILTGLIISARLTSAIFGIATIFVVYLIGREIWNEKKALLPSIILAFSVGFVNLAHQVEETIPMTFFLTLTFLFLMRYLKSEGSNGSRYFIYSCMSAGLAIATKFNAGMILVPLFTAYYIKKGGLKLLSKEFCVGLISMAVVFSILRIGVVLDFYRFVHYVIFAALGKFSGAFREEYGAAVSTTPVWLLQVLNLANGLGLPMFLLFVSSVIFTLVKRNKIEVLLALTFVVPYTLVISMWSVAPFHFIVPVLPFAALIASNLIIELNEDGRHVKPLNIFFILVILHAAMYTLKGDLEYLHDSRDIATKWIEENVPKGAVIETYTLSLTKIPRIPRDVELTGYYEHVKIYDDPFNITNPARYIQMEKNYTLNYMYRVCERSPDYIVVSSWDYAGLFLSKTPFKERKIFYEKLLQGEIDSYEIVAVFGKSISETIKVDIYKKLLNSIFNPEMEKVSPTIVILEKCD